jgi:2-aminoadipate transaminase
MLAALARHMPDCARWNVPEGGMFIWLQLPGHIDTTSMLEDAIAVNVAFVPGAPFFAGKPMNHCLRLSFATVSPQQIDRGIQRLAALVAAHARMHAPALTTDFDA